MSEFDSNPFADPAGDNPFNDPSVTQVTSVTVEPVDQFNPFPAHPTDNLATHTTSPYQPAVLQPSSVPSPQATAVAAQANLLRQQEELERKAAELDRREQELQSRGPTGKQNNWPPLPKSFPIKACFYQDFSEEIPPEYQRVCKMMYYLWMFNCVTLFLNLLACLAYFTTSASPSMIVFIIQTVGIPQWGNSGWITAFTIIGTDKAVGAIMIIVAILFTICAVLSVILLKMVHSMYRRTGASFTKAQHEFSQGVLTNKTFQTAAAGAASTAASSAAQGAFQGNRG
ncbi:hypothetical protein JOQ06_002258 [Pogonophryne albipinna]|uniref:Secretory carrier-associated membrane protein n=1 Tax=Pogonophryne albipinna TaxID=1090488 RepID=A0AAD6B441_9TELE|nr:hypothetical protein JOQ06_002258 [Pogonophryne albipinna]